jgi:ATP-binding cassette subfamily C protein
VKGSGADSPLMTEDELLRSSPLVNAFRVLQKHGLRRQIPLVIAMLIASAFEGLGIGTLLPILRVLANNGPDTAVKHSQLERVIFGIFDTLHLPQTFGAMVILFAVCMTVRAIISQQTSRLVGRMVAEVASELRKEVLDSVLAARWSYFTVNPVGRFVNAVNVESNWASVVYRSSLNVVASLSRALIYCIVGLLIDWRAALIAIILGFGLGLVNRSLTRFGRKAGRRQLLAMRSLVMGFSDTITGFKPLKAMSRHETLIANLTKQSRRIRRALYDLVVSQQLANALPDLLINLVMVVAAYICWHILALPLEDMLMQGLILMRLMTNVSIVQRAMQQTATAEAAYWALQTTINEAREAEEHLSTGDQPTLKESCRFDRVTFSYGVKPVLKEVSLEIPAGRVTTLIGESGSGKTTIADLLLGLFVVESGNITLDGKPLGSLDLLKWREMVGYVPQEVLLFNSSIFDNIALGDPAITDDQVRDALEDAGALEFVNVLADGIHAPVGERGTMISGGQRQRIALARALVHRPALLILDEATSALDPITEAEICETVRRQAGKMTVLAITHQKAWVEIADRVYRVIDGNVVLTAAESLKPVLASAH